MRKKHCRKQSVYMKRTKRDNPHLGFSAVCGGLVEFFVQLKLELCGLESSLGLHGDEPSILHADHQVGLGHVAHLASGEAHTCNTKRRRMKYATARCN